MLEYTIQYATSATTLAALSAHWTFFITFYLSLTTFRAISSRLSKAYTWIGSIITNHPVRDLFLRAGVWREEETSKESLWRCASIITSIRESFKILSCDRADTDQIRNT